MSRIEEFFEKSVDAGIIPQIPMNYDAVSYKIYTGYLENKIDELTAEVAEARKQAVKEFAERVKMAFYYEFDELIPSIMADKIDELVEECAK